MAFLLSLEWDLASRFVLPRTSLFRARQASSCTRCQTFPGPGPLKRAAGCSFPRGRSMMPVSSRALLASVVVVPHASHRLWVPELLRSGRGSDAAVQARLDRDHTAFHLVARCRANTAIGGSLDAQLSDRPVDCPRHQTRPGCAHLLAAAQERHRLAGAFAAYPAPYCATGSAPEPRSKARRSPPLPRARDREQVTPQPGQPTSRLHDKTSSTRASGVRAMPIRWKPSQSTSRAHRSQRSSDTEQ